MLEGFSILRSSQIQLNAKLLINLHIYAEKTSANILHAETMQMEKKAETHFENYLQRNLSN